MIEVAIQLVDPCNQPRSSLSSTISPAFQSLNFNVFSDFTWWRYYILWCFSEIDGTKLEKNPCHMNCSSLFMRCDENMIFICVIQNYMVFIHDSHQPNIHPFNLTSILPPIGSRWATASPRCDLKRLGGSPEATSDRPTLPWNLVGSCGESSLWHACRRWFPWKWQWR